MLSIDIKRKLFRLACICAAYIYIAQYLTLLAKFETMAWSFSLISFASCGRPLTSLLCLASGLTVCCRLLNAVRSLVGWLKIN